MGLGKTVQICVFAKESNFRSGLILCPKSVKTHWAKHLVDCNVCAREDIFICKTGGDIIPESAKWVIANYDLTRISNIYDQLWKTVRDLIVMDEAHMLCNLDAQRSDRVLAGKGSDACLAARARVRVWASGTPFTSGPIGLYPTLKVGAPTLIHPYTKYEQFGRRYCAGYRDQNGWNFNGFSNKDDLVKRLAPFMLRRTKEEVLKDFPELRQTVVYVPLEMQESEKDTQLATLRMLTGKAKIPATLDYLKDTAHLGKRILFCYHREVVEGLHEALPDSSVIYYGGMSDKARAEAIRKFVEEPGITEFIANILSAGTGLDGLQYACNQIVQVEPDWTWAVEQQAYDRAHRLGQKFDVFVTRLIGEESIDETVNYVSDKKGTVFETFFELIKTNKEVLNVDADIKRGADALEKIAACLAVISEAIHYTPAEGGNRADLNLPGATATEPKKGGKGGKKAEQAATTPSVAASSGAVATAATPGVIAPAGPVESAPLPPPLPPEQNSNVTKLILDDVRQAALKAEERVLAGLEGEQKDAVAKGLLAALKQVVAACGADALANIPADKYAMAIEMFNKLNRAEPTPPPAPSLMAGL